MMYFQQALTITIENNNQRPRKYSSRILLQRNGRMKPNDIEIRTIGIR